MKEEKIEAAEKRKKELQLLIKSWSKKLLTLVTDPS